MKEQCVIDIEKKLAGLTAEVATLRAAAEKAHGELIAAEAAVAAARKTAAADPSNENKSVLKRALATLERERAQYARAETALREKSAEEEMQSAMHLRTKQNALARQIAIEKKAQRHPEVMEVYEEAKAARLACETLREKLTSSEAALAETNANLSRATSRNAELTRELEIQKAKTDEQGRRAVELFDECKRLQGVNAELEAKLAAAAPVANAAPQPAAKPAKKSGA